MRALRHLIFLLIIASAGACAVTPPLWRPEARTSLDRATAAKAEEIYPAEYRTARDTFLKAEELLQKGEKKEAEKYFLLAQQEATMVRKKAEAEAARRAEERARLAEEAARVAEERRKEKEIELEEAARLLQQKAAEEAAAKAAAEAARKRVKPVKEQRPVTSYTVRRGQSLPLIAAQPEVYNDRNLWPLLYRANRDQISDPRHLWPGQVLRVPRNSSRDDVAEARRYALERPLH
ncbi:DUF4398 domain-containing protein [Geomonas sp. RF6]|uniref:DUF4398 domain-containing protein n=1 Tax=Geomonas sp. RF6 TaxID=2897342 RepID=UPI001E509B9C|nr:DUF4398 domain-containing protein [Geomonas sp. RF6]UFS70270.1 DUF4398 domain-containing protein [Geomonas sp. RF6]